MGGGASLLAQREQDVDRPRPGACAGPSREIARLGERARQRVARVVDRHACCFQQHLGVEPTIEQELRGVVPAAGEGREQVCGGWFLAVLLGQIFGDAPERDELRLPGRKGPLHLPLPSHGRVPWAKNVVGLV